MTARLKEIFKKYGKVAFGVHCSVSAASVTGLYIAIKNNVDIESLFEKYHLPGFSTSEENKSDSDPIPSLTPPNDEFVADVVIGEEKKKRNRTAELAASTGGALTVAILCNKALFPIRVPITMALTPPVARILARWKITRSGV